MSTDLLSIASRLSRGTAENHGKLNEHASTAIRWRWSSDWRYSAGTYGIDAQRFRDNAVRDEEGAGRNRHRL
jgi:hypothetical protein